MSEGALIVLAVDDEQPQLEDLAQMLRASPRVGELETASNARDAMLNASRRPYDAVFLDVRMPELDGLELARVLKAGETPPELIFVTAFDNYAVSAFELQALDYLMKPVTRDRMEEALERVQAARADTGVGRRPVHGAEEREAADGAVLTVNTSNGGVRHLNPGSILYLKAYGDYMRVFADGGRYLVRARLMETETRLEAHGFLRIHRQYIANLSRVAEVRLLQNGTAMLRLRNGAELPVARRHVHQLRQRLWR